jgi:hypothetical protein
MKHIMPYYEFLTESKVYSVGSRGDEVKKIQQRLIALKLLPPGSDDSVYGEDTKNAVEQFQRSTKGKLEVDGAVGPATFPALMGGSSNSNLDSKKEKAVTNPQAKIEISDSIKKNNFKIDSTQQRAVSRTDTDGCARWVSNTMASLGVDRQGNAWHAIKKDEDQIKFNVLKNFPVDIQNEMAMIFTKINKAGAKPGLFEESVNALTKKIIPNQSQIKSQLKVNDIVGLYYRGSHNFTKAFYEGATGYLEMGKGEKAVSGPYFMQKGTGTPWSPDQIGKNIEYVPGKTLASGGGFGFNTHLGFVGAIVDNEPIIFHAIDGNILSTPFSTSKDIDVLWIKSGNSPTLKGTINQFIDWLF